MPVFAYRGRSAAGAVAGEIDADDRPGAGGELDVVLQRLSGYVEEAAKVNSKVKGAMVYPVTIVGVACLVFSFMMIFVIPSYAMMFQVLGADLALPPMIVMWLSDFMQRYI